MPARRYSYSVSASRYTTLQDKQGPGVPDFAVQIVYIGSSERLASFHFTRACRAQMHDELAYCVTLKRSGEVIAKVKPL
jgi:predicted transcriptional regulator